MSGAWAHVAPVEVGGQLCCTWVVSPHSAWPSCYLFHVRCSEKGYSVAVLCQRSWPGWCARQGQLVLKFPVLQRRWMTQLHVTTDITCNVFGDKVNAERSHSAYMLESSEFSSQKNCHVGGCWLCLGQEATGNAGSRVARDRWTQPSGDWAPCSSSFDVVRVVLCAWIHPFEARSPTLLVIELLLFHAFTSFYCFSNSFSLEYP